MSLYAFSNMIKYNSKKLWMSTLGNSGLTPQYEKRLLTEFTDKEFICFNNSYKDFSPEKMSPYDFVYLDPPYSITKAVYNSGWTEENDIELFNWCDELTKNGIRFMMSNIIDNGRNVNENLKRWSEKYNVIELDNEFSYTGKVKEVIIMNYKIDK